MLKWVPGICPSAYSSGVRTSRTILSLFAIAFSNSATSTDLKGGADCPNRLKTEKDLFLIDLDRLFKKIVNYQDINDGINRLICKLVANKLRIADLTTSTARESIITYIFNTYYVNGYLYHGFSTVYEDNLKSHSFMPGVYNNRYPKMNEVNTIFRKLKRRF